LWLAFLLGSCGNDGAYEKNISEGIIEYKVTYPELDSNNLMLEMLPERMVMKFKKDKYKSELKTAAGIIEMSVIADASNHTMQNVVKLFSDKYVLKLNKEEALKMTGVLPPFQLQRLDEEKKIAEADCKKVLLDFGTGKAESYLFYYTNDIDLLEPNWCTPFNEIEGVLLDYRIENYEMSMRLEAVNIMPAKIDDSEFQVDDSYKELTPEEFEAYVIKNLKTFME